MEFIKNFYRQSIIRGFKPIEQDAVTDKTFFTLAKVENTTLCLLQVSDTNRLDASMCILLRERELEQAIALSPMYSSIWVVFLRVGDSFPLNNAQDKAEEYYGQSPYPVYWYVNPTTQEITVPAGQPDDIMGLKAAILRSFIGDINQDTSEVSSNYGQSSYLEPQSLENSIQDQEPSYVEIDPMEPKPNSVTASKARTSFPVFTYILAIINVGIMVLMYLQGYAYAPIAVAARFGAIMPNLIWGEGEYYRLFTAMFIHFGWTHLFFNVTGMLIFGIRIERYYGRAAFLVIYIASGLMASMASLLFTQGFSARASGAVYGLLGAAFAYTKYTRRSMDIINNYVIMVYLIVGLGMSFAIPDIDQFGHIGGLIAGILVGLSMLKFFYRKRNGKHI